MTLQTKKIKEFLTKLNKSKKGSILLNAPMGIFLFIVVAVLTGFLWNPAIEMISYIAEDSLELYIFLTTGWVVAIFFAGIVAPLKMMVSDDKGE